MPEKQQFREFHDKVYSDYRQVLPGDIPVLFKMKELWSYMAAIFHGSEKNTKEIKKQRIYRIMSMP